MNKEINYVIIFFIIIILLLLFFIKNDKENNVAKELYLNSNINDIVFEDDKVNVYFFWGDGCPVCENQINFFQKLEEEYKEHYNFYGFEVWKNEENAKLLTELSEKLNYTVKGVPFTIIGEKYFSGFSSKIKEEIKEAIISESKKNFDVYKK